MISWLVIGSIALFSTGLFLWWLLITTEGVYLGRRTVIWLYDVYASRYDNIKRYDEFNEDVFLARPLLQTIPHVRAPLVLDVATGTGRLPLALFEQPTFQGRVIALDLSRKMLTVAAEKLASFADRVTLLHYPADTLPFPDDLFDVVTCLEALEFMDHPLSVLAELIRVLRPGGLLVTTNRQGGVALMMPGKTFTHPRFEQILRDDFGLTHVEVQRWTTDYRKVYALKPGNSPVTGPRLLEEVWVCPHCGATEMIPVAVGWSCLACEWVVPIGADGVIEAHGAITRAKNPV